ncbi:Fpg/Nei family DNA glycosylase [Gordonia hankookensis]|uniref:DNA-(apurinic or apyrimidinic site) lyase n=1 Tax=Gordonia hankookensis TaxID=589403 RepID=A0ABR7WEG0_9ACTN|nr:Fpg/Nei family DNA glycosylase [Gordonia hankookensis]MBD1320926.1 Fpg/Nei family DNA glycosylase [Gordonia hankookensis]
MPEGDTVFATATALRTALAGKRLSYTQFRVPRLATTDLSGRIVVAVRSRGKHLLIDVAGPDERRPDVGAVSIHSHLKMEGAWHVYPVGRRWRRPGFQARVVLRTDDAEAVGFDLGILELSDDPEAALGHLGPDLLALDWDRDEAVRRIEQRPDDPIGTALLNQRLLAGIGNVYRSEICFLRGTLPTRDVRDVDVPATVDLSRRLLWANRSRTARTTTGQTAASARLWVYGRRGQLCRRCRTPIERGQLGSIGDDRVIYFCPGCQT